MFISFDNTLILLKIRSKRAGVMLSDISYALSIVIIYTQFALNSNLIISVSIFLPFLLKVNAKVIFSLGLNSFLRLLYSISITQQNYSLNGPNREREDTIVVKDCGVEYGKINAILVYRLIVWVLDLDNEYTIFAYPRMVTGFVVISNREMKLSAIAVQNYYDRLLSTSQWWTFTANSFNGNFTIYCAYCISVREEAIGVI